MQRLVLIVFLLIFVESAFSGRSFAGQEDDLLQRVNQVYHLSEEMVYHGGEGHLQEVIGLGEKMIKELSLLTQDLHGQRRPGEKRLLKLVRVTREKVKEAVRLGKEGRFSASFAATKKASFHAKKMQQAFRGFFELDSDFGR